MITSLAIENYKCFKDFKLEGFGPFNVLVGPNDSGKTALLESIKLLAAVRPSPNEKEISDPRMKAQFGPKCVWRQSGGKVSLRAGLQSEGERKLFATLTSNHMTVFKNDVSLVPSPTADMNSAVEMHSKLLASTVYYRFDAKALRLPSLLTRELAESGEGFPTFLDRLNRTDRKAFGELESEFYGGFPHYRNIEIPITKLTVSDFERRRFETKDAFSLGFRTVHDELLPAGAISDGVLLSLAFMAICHAPNPPKILLIEEPENGVHHASLKEIMRTLKELSAEKGVQVFLTTHSPYLLDAVEPEQVFLFAKDKEGAVHAVRMSDYPNVEDMKRHFMTGEVWTSLDEANVVEKVRGKK